MKSLFECILPIRTVSEANTSDHWTKKTKRRKSQKKYINIIFSQNQIIFPEKVHVHLTRIAPRMLDAGDNLPMSFKTIRDAIADHLRPNLAPGRADDDKSITWAYGQEKGQPKQYAIKIEILEPEE